LFFEFTIDILVLVLSLSVLLILLRLHQYVKLTARQLIGIQEASLETLQQSAQACLPIVRVLQGGFGLFLLNQVMLTYGSWRRLGLPEDEVPGVSWVFLLSEGAILTLVTYGFIGYVSALEQYKPVHLWRPFDRKRFQSGFERRFGLGAVAALALAGGLGIAAAAWEFPLSADGLQLLFPLWHLVLLGVALSYVRWSNLGFQLNLLLILLLWAVATLLGALGQEAMKQLFLVGVMMGSIHLFVVDLIFRLSNLGARSAKISRDKNIILSFLSELAGTSDTPGAIESSFDLQRLMRTTLRFALEQTRGSAGAIYLTSESQPKELFAVAVEGAYPPQQDLALGYVAVKQKHITDLVLSERIPLGQGIVGEAAETGRPIRIEDAGNDPRVRQSKESFLRIRNQLVIPLKTQERVAGVLSVINRGSSEEESPPFDIYDEALLLAVGEQAAIALNSARMHKILAEQEILEREIQIAQEVQQLLLPKECPYIPGFDMGAFSRSAHRVGGDYYDFLWIDEHHLAIVVADVAGKGVPGAITMAMVRSALKAQVRQSPSAREILTEMNQFVYQDTKPETFVSMFLAVLDTRARTVTLARAGHEPLIHLPTGRGSCKILAPDGIALGIDGGEVFRQSLEELEIPLEPGDTLILYTDGITEAMNTRGEEFSLERFVDTLQRSRSGSSSEMLQAIHQAMSEFTGDLPQHDDLTLVLLKVQQ